MDEEDLMEFTCHCGCRDLLAIQRGIERRIVLCIDRNSDYYEYDVHDFTNDTEATPTFACANSECGREWNSLDEIKAEGLLH